MFAGLRAVALLVLVVAGLIVPPAITVHAASCPDDKALYTADELAAIYRHSPLGRPAPDPTDAVADHPAAARLGQALFYDARLSANGLVACATCHQPARAFTDGLPVAKGLGTGTRNTPSLLNAAFGQWFFWDGRSDSQWSQALKPIENPREAGSDRLHILHVVFGDPVLRGAYQAVFGPLPPLDDRRFPAHARPDPKLDAVVNAAWMGMAAADRAAVDRAYGNLGKAIEAYERRLVVGDSAFDRYVAGLRSRDAAAEEALSPAAKQGLRLFVGPAHCELCHAGPAFSDGQFHNLGLPLLPGEVADAGRGGGIHQVGADPFNSAGAFSDSGGAAADERLRFLPSPDSMLGAFKTPSLRNVARTAPYMHDGRFATLEEVLNFYAGAAPPEQHHWIGQREKTLNLVPHLTAPQRQDLIAFLRALTSPPPTAALLGPPRRIVPESGLAGASGSAPGQSIFRSPEGLFDHRGTTIRAPQRARSRAVPGTVVRTAVHSPGLDERPILKKWISECSPSTNRYRF
jgi:cytochrome c peroxidase